MNKLKSNRIYFPSPSSECFYLPNAFIWYAKKLKCQIFNDFVVMARTVKVLNSYSYKLVVTT